LEKIPEKLPWGSRPLDCPTQERKFSQARKRYEKIEGGLTMDRSFVGDNSRERERLTALVARLTDEESRLSLEMGWTIASAFAHLAFWDRRAWELMRKWKQSGVAESPMDVDVTNEALLPLCLAIPPRVAMDLAIAAAEAIDHELEEAPPQLIADITALGGKFRLWRSEHRRRHLDQIEARLRSR
jgi:hypothetical protein